MGSPGRMCRPPGPLTEHPKPQAEPGVRGPWCCPPRRPNPGDGRVALWPQSRLEGWGWFWPEMQCDSGDRALGVAFQGLRLGAPPDAGTWGQPPAPGCWPPSTCRARASVSLCETGGVVHFDSTLRPESAPGSSAPARCPQDPEPQDVPPWPALPILPDPGPVHVQPRRRPSSAGLSSLRPAPGGPPHTRDAPLPSLHGVSPGLGLMCPPPSAPLCLVAGHLPRPPSLPRAASGDRVAPRKGPGFRVWAFSGRGPVCRLDGEVMGLLGPQPPSAGGGPECLRVRPGARTRTQLGSRVVGEPGSTTPSPALSPPSPAPSPSPPSWGRMAGPPTPFLGFRDELKNHTETRTCKTLHVYSCSGWPLPRPGRRPGGALPPGSWPAADCRSS